METMGQVERTGETILSENPKRRCCKNYC